MRKVSHYLQQIVLHIVEKLITRRRLTEGRILDSSTLRDLLPSETRGNAFTNFSLSTPRCVDSPPRAEAENSSEKSLKRPRDAFVGIKAYHGNYSPSGLRRGGRTPSSVSTGRRRRRRRERRSSRKKGETARRLRKTVPARVRARERIFARTGLPPSSPAQWHLPVCLARAEFYGSARSGPPPPPRDGVFRLRRVNI